MHHPCRNDPKAGDSEDLSAQSIRHLTKLKRGAGGARWIDFHIFDVTTMGGLTALIHACGRLLGLKTHPHEVPLRRGGGRLKLAVDMAMAKAKLA